MFPSLISVHKIYISLIIYSIFSYNTVLSIRKYTRQDLINLREEVREMFDHAYSGYIKYAYPYDELRPLTCDGVDTWGSYSLTLIDALDTLAVMGNYSEFRRVVDIVTTTANFDANINVSVFETNIRLIGGLLSAHLLSQRAGVEIEPGWPCNGPLLRLAEDVAQRLLAAFDTKTGMPLGTVNLRYGIPPGETPVTCTAGVGTFILEFATLSRLTGDPIYEEVAMNALRVLFLHRSPIGLFGNHIDVMTGRWIARDSGIGAGVDSYLEYLVKGSILLHKPELMAMFSEARQPIDKYLKKNHWYVWASMHKGQVTLPVFQSLEAYWPGVLTLIGDIETALRSMHNYNSVWKQYGFTPEFYNIAQGEAGTNRESYPLRPELAESAMYLYRATGDPFMLDIGLNILRSIQHSAKTPCGYATIKDTRDHTQENRMESFFLAETTKYLYLLFDPDNFIHNKGEHGRVHTLPSGKQCILDSGGYIFNTEAHPIDPGALNCCHDWEEHDYNDANSFQFKGESLKQKQKRKNVDILKEDENNDEMIVNEDLREPNVEIIQGEWKEIKRLDLNEEFSNSENLLNEKPSEHKVNAESQMIDDEHHSVELNDEHTKKQIVNNLLSEISTKLVEALEKFSAFEDLGTDVLETLKKRNNINTNNNDEELLVFLKEANKNILKKLVNKIKTNHHKMVKSLQKISTQEWERNDSENVDDQLEKKAPAALTEENNLLNLLNELKNNHNKILQTLKKLSKAEGNVALNLQSSETNGANEEEHQSTAIDYESPNKHSANEREEKASIGLTKEHEPTFDEGAAETIWSEGNLSETLAADATNSGATTSQPTSSVVASTSEAITLSDYVRQLVLAAPIHAVNKFDPQLLLHNIRLNSAHYTNRSYSNQYQLLTCKAQPFLIRLTIAGEFLNEK